MARAPSVIRAEKANLEAILASGAKSVTVDGVTTNYDLEFIAKRIRQLEIELGEGGRRRPSAYRVNMDGGPLQ